MPDSDHAKTSCQLYIGFLATPLSRQVVVSLTLKNSFKDWEILINGCVGRARTLLRSDAWLHIWRNIKTDRQV